MDEPTLDKVLFTKIRVNEVNKPEADNVAGVECVSSTLSCEEYTPEEVEETSLLPEDPYPSIW